MSLLNEANARFQKLGTPSAFRARAWAEFNRLGFPRKRDEAWKYSQLDHILRETWVPGHVVETLPGRVRELREAWRAQFDVLVVLNGQLALGESVLSPELSACLIEGDPDYLNEEFEDGFSGLHAALSATAVHLRVDRPLNRPLLVVRWQDGERSWITTRSHFEVTTKLNLVECFVGEGEYFRGELATVDLRDNAVLDWVRVQGEDAIATHFGEVRLNQSANTSASLTQINLGAKWSRNTIRAELTRAGGEARIHGLNFGRERQHVDQRVVVNHRAAHTNSAQLFKGVLRDRARGILNGKIYIARDAQKVNSSQLNHNLLIGSGAEADTKPELEIYADDVKANHGASIGRLDDEKLFYLQSRGIKPEAAERMLADAFVGDVVLKIEPASLREFAFAQIGRF